MTLQVLAWIQLPLLAAAIGAIVLMFRARKVANGRNYTVAQDHCVENDCDETQEVAIEIRNPIWIVSSIVAVVFAVPWSVDSFIDKPWSVLVALPLYVIVLIGYFGLIKTFRRKQAEKVFKDFEFGRRVINTVTPDPADRIPSR